MSEEYEPIELGIHVRPRARTRRKGKSGEPHDSQAPQDAPDASGMEDQASALPNESDNPA